MCIAKGKQRKNSTAIDAKAPASNLPANDVLQRAKLQGLQLLFLRLFQLSQQQHTKKFHNANENRNQISPPFTKNVSFDVFF